MAAALLELMLPLDGGDAMPTLMPALIVLLRSSSICDVDEGKGRTGARCSVPVVTLKLGAAPTTTLPCAGRDATGADAAAGSCSLGR